MVKIIGDQLETVGQEIDILTKCRGEVVVEIRDSWKQMRAGGEG